MSGATLVTDAYIDVREVTQTRIKNQKEPEKNPKNKKGEVVKQKQPLFLFRICANNFISSRIAALFLLCEDRTSFFLSFSGLWLRNLLS